jgi:dolichyl-diphosphooligosaccharide--protein glycosyltransferase
MTDDGRVADLLAERPDLESPLAALLAVDDEADTWTFEDVPVDSGAFGELVARGVVEKTGGEYRLADADAVRQAIERDSAVEEGTATTDVTTPSVNVALPTVDAGAAGLFGGALALVVVLRAFVVSAVFRGEHVVLSGNDPYFYLFWIEQSLPAGESTQLPAGITKGEPLLVATLARITSVFGGPDAAGAVLAVYPVVSAVLTGALLYWLTLRLTADRRIALAAVVILAAMPGHALRTALGFADHHAFDYVWLTLTAAALLALAGVADRDDLAAPKTWLAALALGIGVGAQTLAWDAGPLVIIPVGAVVPAKVLVVVRNGRSPLFANVPLLAGLAIGALLTLYGHLALDWHTEVVAAAPILLLGGAFAVVAVGELAFRLDRQAEELAIAETVLAFAGAVIVWTAFPEFRAQLLQGLDRIFRSDDILETQALFSGDTLGFLLLFGFFLLLALPVLVWATRRAVDDARWVVACSYGWYFFALSLVQVRFTGQLGIFTALFAGVAFVWTAARIDLTDPPAFAESSTDQEFATWTPGWPDASTIVAVFFLFALLGGLGLMQSAIKVQQVTTEDADYQTASWLADYADERGWESHGESYVFSEWGKNRLYNYFVNGNSRSYNYAQSNYGPFMTQTDPDEATAMIGDRVRFVVTQNRDVDREMMHTRLHDNLGSRNGDVAGLGRFRALYVTPNGQRKAFLYVPGATVRGTAASNTTVDVAADVEVPGASFTYERRTSTNDTGTYSVQVAHPGTYTVTTANGTQTVTVPESEVMNETTVGT